MFWREDAKNMFVWSILPKGILEQELQILYKQKHSLNTAASEAYQGSFVGFFEEKKKYALW